MKGTLYTDGTNMRTNTNTTVDGNGYSANTIMTADTIYVWQIDQAQGMKMDIKNYQKTAEEQNANVTLDKGAAKLNQEFDFSCNGWAVNNEMFAVPTDIKFVDITEALDTMKQNPCAICDSMTDAERKQQCKQSLNCD